MVDAHNTPAMKHVSEGFVFIPFLFKTAHKPLGQQAETLAHLKSFNSKSAKLMAIRVKHSFLLQNKMGCYRNHHVYNCARLFVFPISKSVRHNPTASKV